MSYFAGLDGQCDPIGDYSPWGTPFDLPHKNKSVVMVTTKVQIRIYWDRSGKGCGRRGSVHGSLLTAPSLPFLSLPKLDALSLFPYDLSVGGGEAAGIVVLLAAAKAIGQLKRDVSEPRHQQQTPTWCWGGGGRCIIICV